MKIIYGETDISNLILEYKRKGSIDSKTTLLLGNTPSYQIEIKVDNSLKLLQTLTGDICEYDKDGVLKGTYFVYEAPERYTDSVSLVCFDYMLYANIAYDSKLNYPVTIKDQLDEISRLTGLTIDYSNLSTLGQEVNWWDNTIACRNYLGWIAELSGMNVYVAPNGVVHFKSLSITPTWVTEDVDDYEKDEEYVVERVCFDNGLLKLEIGMPDSNTLYLSNNNPYIDSLHDPVQRIYMMYKGLNITSATKLRVGGLDNLQLFDIIRYKDMHFVCLDITSTYQGGEYQIQDIKGELDTKNAEKVTLKYDEAVKLKKLEVIMDQNKQSLDIIAKETSGLNEKFAQLVIDTNGIKQEVKETTEKVESLDTQKSDMYFYLSTSPEILVGGSWAAESPIWTEGKYIWQKTKYTYANGTMSESDPVCVTGNGGEDGNDAILLYIDSSNGSIFKNSSVATTLTVTVIVAGLRLDTSQKLKEHFGQGASIKWEFKRLGETAFNPIENNDPRLSDGGFIFTLHPNDVQTKHTFNCVLDY